MKSLSWAVLGLLLCVPFAGAEVIDSVSFNPARLGRYETLKVSDQLTTKGGIEANAVTVQSSGTVSVNNTGNYKFPVTEVLGSVEMISTDFQADTLNSWGTASFENKSSSASSKISTLNTSTAEVRANILDLRNKEDPKKPAEVSIPKGGSFTLGENNIPQAGEDCSDLRWVERTADDNYKYKVLAFGSCNEGGSHELYGPIINDYAFIKDTCPGNNESSAYTCTDKTTKCVDVVSTYGYRWVNWGGTAWSNTDTCDGDASRAVENFASPNPQEQRIECTDFYGSSNQSVANLTAVRWKCDNTAKCSISGASGTWCGNVICENVGGPDCRYMQGLDLPSKFRRVINVPLDSNMSQAQLNNLAASYCSSCTYPACEKVLLQSAVPECSYQGIGEGVVSYQTFYAVWLDCNSSHKANKKWLKEVNYRKVDCTGNGDIYGKAEEEDLPIINGLQATY